MRLNEITDDRLHPIAFNLVRQLLAKGQTVLLSVRHEGSPIEFGEVTKMDFEPDTLDYEIIYRPTASSGLKKKIYFLPGSHLETFDLKKQHDPEYWEEYWLLSGKWEMPSSRKPGTA